MRTWGVDDDTTTGPDEDLERDPGHDTEDVVEVAEGLDGSLTVELELDDFRDEAGEDGLADEEPDEDDRVTYDASPWATESRTMLTSLLTAEGIVHAWQGTEVTVRAADEDRTDRLVAEVLAAAGPVLDPAAEKVVYEVAEWSVGLQTALADALLGAGVPFEWDTAGDLVVLATDEERVEELLDGLPELDEGAVSADDGLAVHEVLDRVFVAAGRLARRPNDARATVEVVEAATDLAATSVPFGFDESSWGRLVERTGALADALEGEGDPVADDAVAALAAEVRDLVAQYV